LKFLSSTGSGYTSDAVAAIGYAARMGARLSNNSWGGGAYSQALFDTIQSAGQAGAVFIAAAGNDNFDNDATPQYPASYDLDSVVSVAATDATDTLAYFSNYGATAVDLGAPGAAILSLRPGGQFASLSGTSMATPHVTGTAGLLLSQNSSLTPIQIKQLLMFGSDPLASLSGRVASQGRLNAYHALKATIPQWLQLQVAKGTLIPGQNTVVSLSVNTATLSPGTYTQTIAINSNDPAQHMIDLPVVLKVVPANEFDQWIFNRFAANQMLANASENALWNATANPDRDQMNNLLEYITGGDPLVSDPQNAPRMISVNGESLFEFRIKEVSPGASHRVEWTPGFSPATWGTSGLTVAEDTTVDMPPGVHRMRVKLSVPVEAAYFRLTAELNP